MYRTVEFRSTLAGEWQFDAGGSPVVPGGRELAEAIVSRLGRLGSRVSSVGQHSYYGWGFDAWYTGRRFFNVLNTGDRTCYLTVELGWYWVHALLRRHPRRTFDGYCAVLGQALAAIPEVSDIVWEEYRR